VITRRDLIRAGLLTALVSSAAGCIYPPHRYRYRMTVEADTPEGLRTGSAVRELTWSRDGGPSASSFHLDERGEAVAIDLPGGRTLFVLLDVNAFDTVWAGFGGGNKQPSVKDWLDRADADRQSHTYPPRAALRAQRQDYPRLVTFTNIRDPKSVQAVDPDNLASSFGPGVTLKRITLQITDDPVTKGIEKRLGWFRAIAKSGGSLIPMEKASNDGPARYKPKAGYDASLVNIGLSDFSTESNK
jgi:hypothetical protein